VTWFADPAGRTEIEELRRAGLIVKKGDNSIRRGIALVTARIRTGRLKVLETCKNLIMESKLYRYPTADEREVLGENPIDAHNHALGALRYLVSRLDQHKKFYSPPNPPPAPGARPHWDRDDDDDDDDLWMPV
jgi:hypothetical protein